MESEFYLRARREWDERYGDLVVENRTYCKDVVTRGFSETYDLNRHYRVLLNNMA
jgi:hypothetical protein